jgi:hypothetical protein
MASRMGILSYSDPFGLCPEDVGGDGKTASVDDCSQDVQDAWAQKHVHDTSKDGTDLKDVDADLWSAVVRTSMDMRADFGISAGREGGHSVEGRHAEGGAVDINQVNGIRFGAMDDKTAASVGNEVGLGIASRLAPRGLRMLYTPGMAVRYNRPMNERQRQALMALHRTHVHITIEP